MYGIEFGITFEGQELKARATGYIGRDARQARAFLIDGEYDTALRIMGGEQRTRAIEALRAGAAEALMGEQEERALAARAEGFR
jgi:hypothetical protein